MSEPTPRRKTWQAALILAVVFLLGMVSGAALLHIGSVLAAAHGHVLPRYRTHDAIVEELADELELTGAQRTQMHEILDGSREDVEHLYRGVHEELMNILTPEQRAKFEEMHPMPRLR